MAKPDIGINIPEYAIFTNLSNILMFEYNFIFINKKRLSSCKLNSLNFNYNSPKKSYSGAVSTYKSIYSLTRLIGTAQKSSLDKYVSLEPLEP